MTFNTRTILAALFLLFICSISGDTQVQINTDVQIQVRSTVNATLPVAIPVAKGKKQIGRKPHKLISRR